MGSGLGKINIFRWNRSPGMPRGVQPGDAARQWVPGPARFPGFPWARVPLTLESMGIASVAITADDYGLDPAVNRGIEALAGAGAVDAVSIMAHADADLASLGRLRLTPARLGAHLVLVEEKPLGRDPALEALLTDGRLPRSYRSLFSALAWRPSLAAPLAAEAGLQIERLRGLGVDLAFVNSHQHVHLFPPLWKALRPLFESLGLEVRAARRIRPGPIKQLLVEGVSSLSLWRWPLERCPWIHPTGIAMAGRLDLAGAARAGRGARAALAGGERVELVTHPGFESPGLLARYAHWGYCWQTEWSLLASGAVRRALDEALRA